MSRSFRESYLGKCRKPYRYAGKSPDDKKHRSLRRQINRAVDEDGIPIVPSIINRKYGRGALHHRWQFPDRDYFIMKRRGRKFMLRNRIRSILPTWWGYKGWCMY